MTRREVVFAAGAYVLAALVLVLLGTVVLPRCEAELEARIEAERQRRRELLKGCSLVLDDVTINKMTFECPEGTRYIVPRVWRDDLEMQ